MTEVDRSPASAPGARDLPDPAGLRAVFFDFDGVILESVSIKDGAFRDLFAHLPEHLDRILEHHREHLGHSRFEKFEWVYRRLLRRPLDEGESRRLGESFSRRVEERMLSCPAVPGAVELLSALRGRIECMVVSGTPQAELERLIDGRDLRRYFRDVRGTPPAKGRHFVELLHRYRLEPEEVLAVGDGLSDYRAAQDAGTHFVARSSASSGQDWSSIPVPTISDLTDLFPLFGVRAGV
ncbi:MAG: HAD family hydrolase [Thermoanaerobaculia bacterium]